MKSTPVEGFALLALVAFIAMISIAFLLDRMDAFSVTRHQDQVTDNALMQAKEAIIAWSVLQGTPGKLPCPEDTSLVGTANEGQAKSSCNALPTLGRLPWRTLGLGRITDGHGEPLWYGLSPGFRSSPINSATAAGLNVDGTSTAVALVIAPGPTLVGQSRGPVTASSPPLASNYLDMGNAAGGASFISSGPAGQFNDLILSIRASELFGVVVKRVIREIRGDSNNGLVRYYLNNGHDLPDTCTGEQLYNNGAIFYPGSSWLHDNAWFSLVQYQKVDSTTARLSLFGTATMISVP